MSLQMRNLRLVVIALTQLSISIATGSTSARCNVSSVNDWAFNKNNQSPCLIAAKLYYICMNETDRDWDEASMEIHVAALIPAFGRFYDINTTLYQHHYPISEICQCTSLMYSLMSACSLCQGGTYPTWLQWTDKCIYWVNSISYDDTREDLNVPKWAYQDIQFSWKFDPVLASATATNGSHTDPPHLIDIHRAASRGSNPGTIGPKLWFLLGAVFLLTGAFAVWFGSQRHYVKKRSLASRQEIALSEVGQHAQRPIEATLPKVSVAGLLPRFKASVTSKICAQATLEQKGVFYPVLCLLTYLAFPVALISYTLVRKENVVNVPESEHYLFNQGLVVNEFVPSGAFGTLLTLANSGESTLMGLALTSSISTITIMSIGQIMNTFAYCIAQEWLNRSRAMQLQHLPTPGQLGLM